MTMMKAMWELITTSLLATTLQTRTRIKTKTILRPQWMVQQKHGRRFVMIVTTMLRSPMEMKDQVRFLMSI